MERSTLSQSELLKLLASCPGLPADYLAYLKSVGWGETASGRMIYGGPISPEDVYGTDTECKDIVLLGDDFAGNCFGYNLESATYGEISPAGIWQWWPSGTGIDRYVGA
jgi:hypothetical protein